MVAYQLLRLGPSVRFRLPHPDGFLAPSYLLHCKGGITQEATTGMGAITTAVTSALSTVQSDALSLISSVLPYALAIVGAVMVVTIGIRVFKRVSGR